MPLTIEQLSKLYKISVDDFVDYGAERPGSGLLVSAGCGLMMATCDAVPSFRYAMDADVLPPASRTRVADWFEGMAYICDRVAFTGWFSRPENGLPMQAWTRHFAQNVGRPLVYFGGNAVPDMWTHCNLCVSLAEFLCALR
jgi:hypothetical protein